MELRGKVWFRNSNESSWVALLKEVDPLRRCLHFSTSGHHDEVGILPSGSSSYLRKNKGVYRKNVPLQGRLSGREHRGRWRKVTLELKLKKNIKSKIRRYHGKFRPGRQSIDA